MSKTYTGVLLIVGPILTILGYLLMPQNGFGKDPTDPASVVTGMVGNGAQIDIFLLMVALGMAALVGGIYLANRQHAASDKEEDPRTTWGGLITIISFIGYISTIGIIAGISGTIDGTIEKAMAQGADAATAYAAAGAAAGPIIALGSGIQGYADIFFGIGIAVMASAWAQGSVHDRNTSYVLAGVGVLTVLARVILGLTGAEGDDTATVGSILYVIATISFVSIGVQTLQAKS
jgi:hypothetical protein|tara:strand:+ start:229 stop:930 length:702 start_codon:yes stop_codon:yes gene_type:complete